eukprot:RCo003912
MKRSSSSPPVPQSGGQFGGEQDVIRLKPYEYMHVLDNNKNITIVIVGPLTFTRKDHEQIALAPQPCVSIPPMHYCVVSNPVIRNEQGALVLEPSGQVKVRLGDREIRSEGEPFPLYPLEQVLPPGVQKKQTLVQGEALKLQAVRDFVDAEGTHRTAGDKYLFRGPGTYQPRIEEEILEKVKSTVILSGEGLTLRATEVFTDRTGVKRTAGEVWLYTQAGAFLPDVDEVIVSKVQPIILTDRIGLHLEALSTFTDVFGKSRVAGSRWLVTRADCASYLLTPTEKLVAKREVTVLKSNEFCVVVNCYDPEIQSIVLGRRQVRCGERSFFLHPGEVLENGVERMFLLTENSAVLLQALDAHEDTDDSGNKVMRSAGDKWCVNGPRTYFPTVHVKVLEQRWATPLAQHEGIYVRDQRTGKVRVEKGKTYMLLPEEELWEKSLPLVVEQKLAQQNGAHMEYIQGWSGKSKRDKTRLVTYNLPHNTICQVYDFRQRTQRVLFGPDRVDLGPDEEFTVLSLSGSEWVPERPNMVMPKVEGRIRSLYLFLGPDTLSDVLEVETADHARLRLQLSYEWHFDVNAGDIAAARQAFNVPDFVADVCKRLASRIRAAVAAVPFDEFHRKSNSLIASGVFGVDENGLPRSTLYFKANRLCVTSVDIQNVECVDDRTRESMSKSVTLAIEICTASQEADARHAAEEREQQAKGELQRQVMADQRDAEEARKELLERQAETRAIQASGASKAEAKANAESRLIEGE